MRDKQGATRRQHLESAAKQGNPAAIAELAAVPPLPLRVGYLWGWWCELAAGRQSGMGLNGLAWSEIRAWQQLTGRAIALWELEVIRSIDALFLAAQQEKPKPK